jgi:hypothetical protein
MPPPSQTVFKQAESEGSLALKTEARRLEAIQGFTDYFATYNCDDHLVKSCSACLAVKLIPYNRSEEVIQVSAAKDAMSKLMLSFGGDRFGLEVSHETKAPLVQAPPVSRLERRWQPS